MDICNQDFGRARSCETKDRLYCRGERYDYCLIVISGLLVRECTLADGCRQIVGLYLPGDVCGLSTITDGYADHDVIALSPAVYMPVTREWLASIACRSIESFQAVLREMSREGAIAAAWTVNLGQRSAYQRIAHFICELEARIRASGQAADGEFSWPGTQAELSAIVGLSLVHVNKTLRKLETDDLVSFGRRVTIHNLERLRHVAGFNPAYLGLDGRHLGDKVLVLSSQAKRHFNEAGSSAAAAAVTH